MGKPKVHYPFARGVENNLLKSLCGRLACDLTEVLDEVTCKSCERELLQLARRIADEKQARDEVAEAPFEPTGEHAAPPKTELGAYALRVLARSLVGEVEHRYEWTSLVQAIAELAAYRADGQGLRSTSDPGRFEKLPRGRVDPMRATAGRVDRLRGVAAALEGAYGGSRVFGATEITVAQQRQILVWWATLVHHREGEGEPKDRIANSLHRLIEEAWDIRLTDPQLQEIRAAGYEAVRLRMEASGELRPKRKTVIERARTVWNPAGRLAAKEASDG